MRLLYLFHEVLFVNSDWRLVRYTRRNQTIQPPIRMKAVPIFLYKNTEKY